MGGAWQLSRQALIKARLSTKGDIDATVGGTIGMPFPSVTIAGTVRGNVLHGGSQFGVALIVEDM